MSLSFAQATENDAREIALLRNSAAHALTHRHGEGSWSWKATERGVLRDLSRPRFSRTIIARDGGKIVATLCLQTKKPWAIDIAYFTPVKKTLYLINMAVDPARQRQGLGRLLIKEAESLARQWPANAVRLDAWDGPAGAGDFYSKCGFREVGRVIYRKAPLIYLELVI